MTLSKDKASIDGPELVFMKKLAQGPDTVIVSRRLEPACSALSG